MTYLKRTTKVQFLLAIILGLVYKPLFDLIIWGLPDIGWHFMSVGFIQLLFFQVAIYIVGYQGKLVLYVLSYLLNIILWVAEIFLLDMCFGGMGFWEKEYSAYFLSVVLSVLWVSNKLLFENMTKK